MENKKPDSHTARKNFAQLAGLVASAALLIALAYIFHLNGFGETPQVTATSTTQPTFTPPTAAPTPLPPTAETIPTTVPATEAEAPVVSNGIQDLKLENIFIDKPRNLIEILSKDIKDPAKTQIVRGKTYGYTSIDYGGGNKSEWIIMPIILRNSKTVIPASASINGALPADLFKQCTADNPRDCSINPQNLDNYKAWFKQQFCGDDPNCAVILGLMNGPKFYENQNLLVPALKAWEKNRELALVTDNTFGGGGKYTDPLVDKYAASNSVKIANFIGNPDVMALDGAVVEVQVSHP